MKTKSIFRAILFVLLVSMGYEASAQCHSSWKFAAPIEVSNTTEFPLYSFQVKAVVNTASLVSQGKMQSDGDDIRFSEEGSCDFLDYWIESGMNTSNTVIWIKTNVIPAEGSQTLTMYYGNSSAALYSNGDLTFDFFDDFTGSSLNTNKWNKYGPGTSTFMVSSGKIQIKSILSSADAILRTKNTISGQITAEANFLSISSTGTGAPSIAILSNTGFFGYTLNYKGGSMNLGTADGGCNSYTNTTIISSTTSAADALGIWGLQWPVSNRQAAHWKNGTSVVSAGDTGKNISSSVNVAIGNLCNGAKTIDVDWVRVRKYASVEPTTIPDLTKEKKNDVGTVAINVDPGPYCQGASVEVDYSTFGNIDVNNVFTLELSDSSGNFDSPHKIGTYSSSGDGTIFGTLPTDVWGDHFSIRVSGTDTALTVVASPANIRISPPPAAYAGENRSICQGTSTSLGAAAVSGSTYKWTNNFETFSSTSANPSVSPTVTTTYTVTEINTIGCKNTNSVTVTVNPLPVLPKNMDKSVCKGSSVTLGETAVSGLSYVWTDKSGNILSTDAQYTVNPQTITSYSLTVTNTTTGCSNVRGVIVTVNTPPTANAGADQTIDLGSSATIGSSSLGKGFQARFFSISGDNFSTMMSSTFSVSVSPTKTTTYVMEVMDFNTSCGSTDTVVVKVNDKPKANPGLPDTICAGQSTQIGAAAVSGSTYSWTSDPSGFTSTNANPTVAPTVTTTYTITETFASGAKNSNTVTITVNQLPDAKVASSQILCAGNSVSIGGTAVSGNTYSWSSSPSGFSSTSSNPSVNPSVKTTYTLTEITPAGCSNSNSVTITPAAPLSVNAGSDVMYFYGYDNTPTLTATTTASDVTYKWSTGATTKSITVNPTSTTDYWVMISKDGCSSAKDSVKVKVRNVLCHDEEDYKGKDKTYDKIEICHKGNRICVSKDAAATHLAHGCKFGNCSTSAPEFLGDETEEEVVESPEAFFVYPNPFTYQTTIDLSFIHENEVIIDVISMDGKVVKQVFSGKVEGQTPYRFTLDGSNLTSGLYLVRVAGDHLMEYKKISLQKGK